MKHLMRFFALSTVAILTLTGCRFTAPSAEEERGWLTEAGYEVTNLQDGDEHSDILIPLTSVEECLYASKESDEIYLIYFWSVDDASFNYSFVYSNLKMGQINELIYVGTSQAIKDAKL